MMPKPTVQKNKGTSVDRLNLRSNIKNIKKRNIEQNIIKPLVESSIQLPVETLVELSTKIPAESKYKEEKIGILIVNYNNLNYTKKLINNLDNQINKSFEVWLYDQNSGEAGTNEFLNKYLDKPQIKIFKNNINKDLNRIWNWFYENNSSEYLCFLNNDIEITNNFTDDIIKTFMLEEKIGIIVHPTNNLKYVKSENKLNYRILNPPRYQGWDFTIRRKLYDPIPDSMRIFGGDDLIFAKTIKKGYEVAITLSSPIIHYKAKTRIKINDIMDIQKKDIINFCNEISKNGLKTIQPTINDDEFSSKYPPDGIKLTQNKNCIYTVIIGNYDNLDELTQEKERINDWDYICFTNNKTLKSNIWRMIYVEENFDIMQLNNISTVEINSHIKNISTTKLNEHIKNIGKIELNKSLKNIGKIELNRYIGNNSIMPLNNINTVELSNHINTIDEKELDDYIKKKYYKYLSSYENIIWRNSRSLIPPLSIADEIAAGIINKYDIINKININNNIITYKNKLIFKDKIKISFIISYKESDEYRKINLIALLNYLSKILDNKSEIIIVEQDSKSKIDWLMDIKKHEQINHIFVKNDGIFNKGWGYNIGVKESNGEYLVFHDSDLFLKLNSYYPLLNLLDKFDVINPYKILYGLDEIETRTFVKNNYDFNLTEDKKQYLNSPISGGVFMMKKEKYLLLKGFDEKCYGWGPEDCIFDVKIHKMKLSVYNSGDITIHVYHPKNDKKNEYYLFSKRNYALYYKYADMTDEELKEKINNTIINNNTIL